MKNYIHNTNKNILMHPSIISTYHMNIISISKPIYLLQKVKKTRFKAIVFIHVLVFIFATESATGRTSH